MTADDKAIERPSTLHHSARDRVIDASTSPHNKHADGYDCPDFDCGYWSDLTDCTDSGYNLVQRCLACHKRVMNPQSAKSGKSTKQYCQWDPTTAPVIDPRDNDFATMPVKSKRIHTTDSIDDEFLCLPCGAALPDVVGGGLVAIVDAPVSAMDIDSDCYSELSDYEQLHIDHNVAPSSRQQSREFLRRLDLKCPVHLPPDVPSPQSVLAVTRTASLDAGSSRVGRPRSVDPPFNDDSPMDVAGRGGSSDFQSYLVAKDVSRKDWMQNNDAKAAV